MIYEEFNSERDFNNKFPSGFYLCPICGYMTNNKYYCQRCKFSAKGLFKTLDKGYRYKILSNGTEDEIFKPIELEKGKFNG